MARIVPKFNAELARIAAKTNAELARIGQMQQLPTTNHDTELPIQPPPEISKSPSILKMISVTSVKGFEPKTLSPELFDSPINHEKNNFQK